MNRRIRSRTYGGVRGRGLKGPLLLDAHLRGKIIVQGVRAVRESVRNAG
jgi:hypothetical protein